MQKLIPILLSFLLISGCANDCKLTEKKVENLNEVTVCNDVWPTFTDKEIEDAKIVVMDYYNNKNLPNAIEGIEYNMDTDEDGNIYNRAFGSLSEYKNSNSIIFLIHTKDIDNCDQSRLIVLTRENKDSNWKVVNEGL
ncbi:hypothetical protein DWV13_16990 [Clostridium botulinum]|uniref:hypothetical protein n=1 Tax=Clostridium TaxID=1485 RepID=UPI0013F6CE35|nr:MULTISPECIES: hypothetical protein [Clostridium]MCS6133281.1 hypothetical protein [Clostridium botulinum]NFL46845.1 hypothetical protein [Clostridium botulinum]NFL91317.1 hypothetical protein [Clostridium botulinum]